MWKNLGDMNFLAFGGGIVKPLYQDVFHVLNVDTESGEEGNEIRAVLCTVDITDGYLSKNDVLYAVGLEELADKPMQEIMRPEQWAKEFVNFYSDNTFQPEYYKGKEFVTEQELVSWMDELGILKDIPELL